MVLQAGDKFPEGVKFGYVDPTVCGIPQMYDANKEWAGKKVVIKFEELKSKGVDKVAFISNNDEYVLAGWGKVNKVPKGEDFVGVFRKSFG
ncbi:unnamed protein product [Aureobasidium pullulans]|nr:unnamed protein product [Aureobasidium pullulans]